MAKQEEVQEWAIQFSVNQQVVSRKECALCIVNVEKHIQTNLPLKVFQVEKSCMTRECEVCKHCIYEASLLCFNCKVNKLL